jgi:hypothetical protein
MTIRGREAWRRVPPVPRSQAEQLASSRHALGAFLTEQFERAFSRRIDEVMFETFPDGLYVTLYADGAGATSHNVWGVSMASALSDAGVDVHVVVRPSSDRLEAVAR